ncbi:MAG TPA: DUF1801 domain-containing protein [Candidatus Saccharimonadales bacterium]|nr:DUF1801 domain-containing protein [Candidatus Saccharimonadales bacterium]
MSVIDDYLKEVEPAQRAELERIRQIVRKLVPEAEEVISYGMPAFKYKNKYFIFFAAFKNHMSVFPGAPVKLKDKLKGYKLRKGTIQFTLDNPLPEALIKELVQSRLDDISKN